ncbi:MAG TPA: metallophosphoesterase [Phycisphaerae bacterium]|nr:metallophosphoesterase [Phycisphaerae bacterium]
MKNPPKACFRIAHLSDLHMTADDSASRTEPAFAERLKGMNENFRRLLKCEAVQRADLVLITGDVTDSGERQAWQQFSKALTDASIAARTLVVLGNHDICGLRARVGWPKMLKRTDLERARHGLLSCKQPAKYPWARQFGNQVVVLGLDSNNSGNLTVVTNAVGRIGFRQLAATAALLHKYRHVPIKIVALHHSPNIPERATSMRRGQPPVGLVARWLHELPAEDRHGLRLLCITHRVRLVLHGHLHAAEDRAVNGVRIVGAPATTQPVKANGASNALQFYQYAVRWPGGRVERSLKTVTP